MKPEQKKAARALRQQGKSIRDIEYLLGVARSSVSRWVRDITLTQDQLSRLYINGKGINSAIKRKKEAKEKRESLRQSGQKLYALLEADKKLLATIGCMLYWCEGTKKNNRHYIAFSNSDPAMLQLFMMFLQQVLNVKIDKVKIQIQCYDDVHTVKEIESYWVDVLKIKAENVTKTQINKISCYSKKKRAGSLVFGTCKIMVYDYSKLQFLYGMIREVCQQRELNSNFSFMD